MWRVTGTQRSEGMASDAVDNWVHWLIWVVKETFKMIFESRLETYGKTGVAKKR